MAKIDTYTNELFVKCENEEQIKELVRSVYEDDSINDTDFDGFIEDVYTLLKEDYGIEFENYYEEILQENY